MQIDIAGDFRFLATRHHTARTNLFESFADFYVLLRINPFARWGKRRGYIYIRDIYSRGKIRGGEGTKKGRKEWLQVCLFIRTPKNEIVVKIPLPSVTPESLNIYRRGDAAREYLILLFIARLFFFLTLFTFYL